MNLKWLPYLSNLSFNWWLIVLVDIRLSAYQNGRVWKRRRTGGGVAATADFALLESNFIRQISTSYTKSNTRLGPAGTLPSETSKNKHQTVDPTMKRVFQWTHPGRFFQTLQTPDTIGKKSPIRWVQSEDPQPQPRPTNQSSEARSMPWKLVTTR